MRSIRAQLSIFMVAGLTILLGTMFFLIDSQVSSLLRSNLDLSLKRQAETTVGSIYRRAKKLSFNGDATLLEYFAVVDTKGNRVIGNDEFLNQLPDSVRLSFSHFTNSVPVFWTGAISGVSYRFMCEPFFAEDLSKRAPDTNPKHEAWIIACAETGPVDGTIGQIRTILVITFAVSTCLTIALVNLGIYRGLLPIKNISQELESIKATDLTVRFHSDVPPELSPLVEKINELLVRLDGSFSREKQFSNDLAHELRTPVTEQITLAEVMLQFPGQTEEVRQAFQDVAASAAQMEALISALLELMRNEAALDPPRKESCDLRELARYNWKSWEAGAQIKQQQVEWLGFENPKLVETDPLLLSVILKNLMSNAVAYCPIGGRICIDLAQESLVEISNTVEDLTPSDLPRMSDRFWRKEEARSGAEHFGLGLSIVKSICKRLRLGMVTVLESGEIRIRLEWN